MKLDVRLEIEVSDETTAGDLAHLREAIEMSIHEMLIVLYARNTRLINVAARQAEIRKLAEERREIVAAGLKKAVPR